MLLNRNDIEKITEILEKFPDVTSFKLQSESGSGIGSVLTMTFAQKLNGVNGSLSVEISGVEDW